MESDIVVKPWFLNQDTGGFDFVLLNIKLKVS